MPLARSASVNARVVRRASSMRQALRRAAFSRSSRPMRPSRWERVTVIALPAPPILLTPKGLEHVGPRAFGYDLDFQSVFA